IRDGHVTGVQTCALPIFDLDDNWAPGPSCTLGFNATITFWGQGIYSGRSVEERSFITASHCTRTQGGTEQTPFYQPDFPDNFVGTEVSDPPYTVLEVVGSDLNRHTCALNSVCRASDAARIAYAPGVPFHFSIARPRGFGTRSLEVVGELPIIAEGGIEIQGAPASKVGMRTGWTGGVIGMTCGDVT